uniref:Capsid protein n=1 Tax=Alphatorquevirus homin3 TaxID=3048428 RepID=A0AAU8H4C5_9VIRU
MAYWWYRRRRRAPRWRRRRWRVRRPRRRRTAVRRRRGRRRVRKRRGRWRRSYRKWRRGRKRRKHKRRLVLTQWQPAFIRRCYIVGFLPLIICGENTSARNFATHSDDLISNGPYGGGMTTTKFTLRILYDEHLRWLNYWTVSNEDLDLCRYLGGTFYAYRHPTVDFIVQIHTSPPFLDTPLTGPSIHPGMLMLAKNKILIPSLKTRPNKKHKVKIRFRPPKLFEDKWYPQSELCDTTLLTVFATACDLQFPFGSPLTDNPCVNFQVLGSPYKRHLSILPDKLNSAKSHFDTKLYSVAAYYNTFQTIAQMKPSAQQTTFTPQWSTIVNNTQLSINGDNQAEANDTWYLGNAYNAADAKTAAEKIRKKYLNATRKALPALLTLGDELLEYHTGIYSSIFLSAGRSYFETLGAYTDIIYNPFVDKGIGNKVWLDPLTKEDAVLDTKKAKVLIEDQPIWAALFGYTEFAAKYTGDSAITANYRLVIRCPYTDPMLVDRDNELQGFVPYSKNFGNGKMPGGSANVPLTMRIKWYPMLFHQLEVLEELVQSGPFAYKGDQKSCVLALKYIFRWKWGGNPVSHQIVRNPCKGGTRPRREPRSVQAADPKYVTPRLSFHSWDFRRGLFGAASIKRMSEESGAPVYPTGPPRKRPKRDTDPYDSQQEENSSSRHLQLQPWVHSSQEVQSEEETPQVPQNLQEQLLQQLREQQQLRLHLQSLANQVLKIKAGYSIHPLLSSQA